MTIRITFKHLPASGKIIKCRSFKLLWWRIGYNLYCVVYNTKGSYQAPGNKHRTYYLPKRVWGWL